MAEDVDQMTRLLVHVRYATAAVTECLAVLQESVERARAMGASWTEIADAVGIPASEARRRFADAAPVETG
jgi:hypothetical protein